MLGPLDRLGMVGDLAPVGHARQPVGRDVDRRHARRRDRTSVMLYES